MKLRPSDRPTAEALLQHPFIIGGDLTPETNLPEGSEKAMRDVEGTDDIFSGKSSSNSQKGAGKGEGGDKQGAKRTPTSAGESFGSGKGSKEGSQTSPKSLEAIADATMNNYTTLDDFSLSLDTSMSSSVELKRGGSTDEGGDTTAAGSAVTGAGPSPRSPASNPFSRASENGDSRDMFSLSSTGAGGMGTQGAVVSQQQGDAVTRTVAKVTEKVEQMQRQGQASSSASISADERPIETTFAKRERGACDFCLHSRCF